MKMTTFAALAASFMLCGCTISVVDTHTESGSTTSLDDDQTASAKVNPMLNVPIKSDNSSVTKTVPPTETK